MQPQRQARKAYLEMMDRLGRRWLTVFGDNVEFYSTAYWDLLTALWLSGRPMRKTEAMAAMKGIKSPHTAGKYLEAAIKHGLVVEEDNPADARSRLVRLDETMKQRLDRFLDDALSEVAATAERISAPEETSA